MEGETMNGCAACEEKRQHTAADWANYPLARHGFVKEQGYSTPALDPDYKAPFDPAAPMGPKSIT
jgi:hypothetical protein